MKVKVVVFWLFVCLTLADCMEEMKSDPFMRDVRLGPLPYTGRISMYVPPYSDTTVPAYIPQDNGFQRAYGVLPDYQLGGSPLGAPVVAPAGQRSWGPLDGQMFNPPRHDRW